MIYIHIRVQMAEDARQQAANLQRQTEANRGYRKMRDVEVPVQPETRNPDTPKNAPETQNTKPETNPPNPEPALCPVVSTRGPSWGHPMLVLGAPGSFLEPFCGYVLPKVDKLCSKLTFSIPPRRALSGSAQRPARSAPPTASMLLTASNLSHMMY